MKMPNRPFFPITVPPDIFGLKAPGLLHVETAEQMRGRIASVEEGVKAAFKAASDHLGEDEARRLFRKVVRKPKRGPGKALASDRDFRLLKEYDAAVVTGESVTTLARRLRSAGSDLGNTEGAIAAQIRKLIKERKARQQKAAFDARLWRMATRNDSPTLLGAAVLTGKPSEK